MKEVICAPRVICNFSQFLFLQRTTLATQILILNTIISVETWELQTYEVCLGCETTVCFVSGTAPLPRFHTPLN